MRKQRRQFFRRRFCVALSQLKLTVTAAQNDIFKEKNAQTLNAGLLVFGRLSSCASVHNTNAKQISRRSKRDCSKKVIKREKSGAASAEWMVQPKHHAGLRKSSLTRSFVSVVSFSG